MPIPSPTPEQRSTHKGHNAFLQKCMSDPVMLKEFPKQSQRSAVCYRQLSTHKKKHGAKANWDDFVKETRKNGINLLP